MIPIYTEGLREVMPKSQREPRPAAVRVRIGPPVWLDDAASVPDGTARLEDAMRDLARDQHEIAHRHDAFVDAVQLQAFGGMTGTEAGSRRPHPPDPHRPTSNGGTPITPRLLVHVRESVCTIRCPSASTSVSKRSRSP